MALAEHNMTPIQLWTIGRNQHVGSAVFSSGRECMQQNIGDDVLHVLQNLRPLTNDGNHGIEHFLLACNFLNEAGV